MLLKLVVAVVAPFAAADVDALIRRPEFDLASVVVVANLCDTCTRVKRCRYRCRRRCRGRN